MSPQLKEEIIAILDDVVPIVSEDVFGREDLNALLDLHPDVERRNFKLWITSSTVLQRFLNNEVFSRTEELLEGIDARAKFFVQTDKYAEALDQLDQKKACVIVGPPGVGKSLLAEMLILTYSHHDYEVVPISADISEGYELWNNVEPQIFYYDDFLGQTNLAESLGKNEDNRLSNFLARVENSDNKRFILTSREQILRTAESRSDRVRWASSAAGKTIVTLSDYSLYARGQMLYNHIYFSKMPMDQRAELVESDNYFKHVTHPNFNPRLVQIVLRRSAHSWDALNKDLTASLENPEDIWVGSYNDLSRLAQLILRILVAFPPSGSTETQLRTALGSSYEPQGYSQALKILEGTWIRLRPSHGGILQIDFANPSCRDFIKEQLMQSSALAVESIEIASTVESLALLFGYAQTDASRKSQSRANNAVHFAFQTIKDSILERISEMYAREAAETPTTYSDTNPFTYFRTRDPRPRMLSLLLPLATGLPSVGLTTWVEKSISEIISPTRDRTSRTVFDAAELLKLASEVLGRGLFSARIQVELIDFAVGQVETWDELEYLATVSSSLDVDLTSDGMQEIALTILHDQFEHLRDDSDDIDEVSQGADALGYLADEFGMDLTDEVEELRKRVQTMPDHDDVSSGPRYRPAPSGAAPTSESVAVRELFQGLLE